MITKTGLDLSALADIQPPNISIQDTAIGLLNELPRNANEITNGWFAYLILFTIFVLTYWYLSDKNPLADFKYSDIRALTLSFGITSSIGITLVTIGFIESWMAVVFCILSFMLTNIILIMIENKE